MTVTYVSSSAAPNVAFSAVYWSVFQNQAPSTRSVPRSAGGGSDDSDAYDYDMDDYDYRL